MESIAQFIGDRMADPFGVLVGALWFGLTASLIVAGAGVWRGERKVEACPAGGDLVSSSWRIAAGAYVAWRANTECIGSASQSTVMSPRSCR
jgi:hypothetical protein